LFGSAEVRDITGENPRQAVEVPKIAAKLVAPKPAPKVVEPVEPAPAPASTQAATPKRGFGASKPAAKATPAAAAPVNTQAATSLADEIAALVGEVNADDA